MKNSTLHRRTLQVVVRTVVSFRHCITKRYKSSCKQSSHFEIASPHDTSRRANSRLISFLTDTHNKLFFLGERNQQTSTQPIQPIQPTARPPSVCLQSMLRSHRRPHRGGKLAIPSTSHPRPSTPSSTSWMMKKVPLRQSQRIRELPWKRPPLSSWT